MKCNKNVAFVVGIVFTLVLAGLGTKLAGYPVISRIGPMLASILLAVVYRNFIGYPEPLRKGIQFSAQKILRFAIVLFGFKLNVDVILHKGLTLLAHDVMTIILAIAATVFVARLIKAERKMSLMLGVGTGVCGAAAIAAVSPIVGGSEEDTAISVGIIALMGTIFALIYTALRPSLPLSAELYGVWTGISLHEIAHVAAAAGPAGANALAVALLAKLGRVFLLIPVSFILSVVIRGRGEAKSKTPFPWFLVGFVATSLIGTYVPMPKSWLTQVSTAASFLLAAAMVGLGLNVHLSHLRNRALRPLAAMAVASVLLSVVSYLTLSWF